MPPESKSCPLIVGNWKMHGDQQSIRTLLHDLTSKVSDHDGVHWVVLGAFIHIPLMASLLQSTPILWGAQNLSDQPNGAYTGDISASMLKDYGCRYVLVGHSERRRYHGESNQQVAAKWHAACQAGLIPILCVGETKEQKEAGATASVIESQLDAIWGEQPALPDAVVVAYEPVWAIGSGLAATPEAAQAVHAHIRAYCGRKQPQWSPKLQVLYGGSLGVHNAEALFAMPDIDGGLIGGASLEASNFLKIGGLCSTYY